ncbi:hypothetical protein D3C77_614890 [compost metagenome]
MEQEIIHVPELARMLGRTESSIRSARQDGASWLPPFFKQGKRACMCLQSQGGNAMHRRPWPACANPACLPGCSGTDACSA